MTQKNRDIIRRSRHLRHGRRGNGPVVYWMERDQRIEDNWALLFAQQEALIRKKDLLIVFFLDAEEQTDYSGQLSFQMYGLAELQSQAEVLNFNFFVFAAKAETILPGLMSKIDGHLLVTDFSPLRKKQNQCQRIGKEISMPFVVVDSHNIIPCWEVSTKKEYAAYTIRPKIHRLLQDYLTDFPKIIPHPYLPTKLPPFDVFLITEKLQKHTTHSSEYVPGADQAFSYMKNFIDTGLERYDQDRNNPNLHGQSNLSPYLHFGQLAPQRLALEVSRSACPTSAKDSFLEELIVRRELADNFCFYEPSYDDFKGFPTWAQQSLNEHREDRREYAYTLEQLDNGATHELLWNSCQRDLVNNNKLHGYLRMYWAKKILEWSPSPEEALHNANLLNDRYSIDGCDPNGYTGCAWSIGGVHDRAWPERDIFGKIRYMNERGCRRKFDVTSYIAKH